MSVPSLRLSRSKQPPRVLRFDPYDVDLRAYELRKHGVRIKLRQQSFQILQMLLESPGEVILREEIRERLWPNDTVVEFEHSINASVQKLRDALCESAETPRFIETVKGRGYRFIGRVEVLTADPAAAFVPGQEGAQPMPGQRPRVAPGRAPGWRRAAWLIAGIICIASLTGLLFWWKASFRPEPKRVFQLGPYSEPIVSPDGESVVYRTEGGLILRRLDATAESVQVGPQQLIGPPAWSPDSRHLVYPTHAGLVKIRVPDGTPVVLPRPPGPTRGISWGEKDTILVAFIDLAKSAGVLTLIPASGGSPTRLQMPGFEKGIFYYPRLLPGGEDFLFTWIAEGDPEVKVYLGRVRNGKVARPPVMVSRNVRAAGFVNVSGGQLLFAQNDKLYAQRLNVAAGKLESEPKILVNGVFSTPGVPRPFFSASNTGVLTWRSGTTAFAQLNWFERQGRNLGAVGPACDADEIRLFRDDKHILLWTASGQSFVVEVGQKGWTQLPETSPRGTPDSLIGEQATIPGAVGLLRLPFDANSYKSWRSRVELGSILDFSPDRKTVLVKSGDWLLRSAKLEDAPDTSRHERAYQTQESVLTARFAPDGKWIVYASRDNRLPTPEVFIQPFPPTGTRKQISSGGGLYPVWRQDGREIVYLWNGKIYSVALNPNGRDLNPNPPEALFAVRTPSLLNGGSQPLAITGDGSRIVFIQEVEQPVMSYIMTGWDAGLNQ